MEFDREEMRRELAKVRDEFTCTKNERAFLDEIRENGEWMNSLKCLVVKKQDPNSHEQTGFLFQSDFTRSNLSELVEGKG